MIKRCFHAFTSPWTRFAIEVAVLVTIALGVIFTGLFLSNKALLEAQIESQARAHFKNIVLTRTWISNHGGVWVEKRPGIESNPYLKNPDMTASDGRVFTKKNPALVTREISELARQKGDFSFHITSLKLVNPNNAPDAFERTSLAAFERDGLAETSTVDHRDGTTYFRYMAPLFIEPACLSCHDDFDYKVGDVRGGISITFSIEDIQQALTRNALLTAGGFTLTVGVLLILLRRFSIKLRSKLLHAEGIIRDMAVTDELTRLKNRRYLLERLAQEYQRAQRHGARFGCILCDIDHFKQINDRHGHAVGDLVLRALADTLSTQCRSGDVVGRWGGEEFLLLLPEAGETATLAVAEKLRAAVADLVPTDTNETTIRCTASFGVACLDGSFGPLIGIDTLVSRADQALYRAKTLGRNRVEPWIDHESP